MTNFNGIYTKDNVLKGKPYKYQIYNTISGEVYFQGHTRKIDLEGVVKAKYGEIEEGLSDNYTRKKQKWHVKIAIAKVYNEPIAVRKFA